MISKIGLIIFFGLYGLNAFVSIHYVGIILGIVAIVIAIALIIKQ